MLTTVNFISNTANSLACRHGFLEILFSYYNNFSRLRELLFLHYDYDAPLCTGNNPKLQRDACTTPTFSPNFRKISIDYSKLKLSHNVSGFPNLTNSVRSYFIKWSKFFLCPSIKLPKSKCISFRLLSPHTVFYYLQTPLKEDIFDFLIL